MTCQSNWTRGSWRSWQRGKDGSVCYKSGQPVLEIVFIKRNDNGQWALPGVRHDLVDSSSDQSASWKEKLILALVQGMVEAGDTVGMTLKKEFGEEALRSINATPSQVAD